MHGHDVFQAHCAQCHYDRTSDPLHGPTLRGIYKKPYLPSGAPANDDRVSATVLHGRNLMPAQPNLDPQDLNDLLTYLHTL
jgi:mono/diheme cytochrome c family protein